MLVHWPGQRPVFECLWLHNFCVIQHACHDQKAAAQTTHHSRAHDNKALLYAILWEGSKSQWLIASRIGTYWRSRYKPLHAGRDWDACRTPRNANIPDASRSPEIVYVPLWWADRHTHIRLKYVIWCYYLNKWHAHLNRAHNTHTHTRALTVGMFWCTCMCVNICICVCVYVSVCARVVV